MMSVIINYIVILVILGGVGYFAYHYYQNLKQANTQMQVMESAEINLDILIQETKKTFSRTLKKSMNDYTLSRTAYNQKAKARAFLRNSMDKAGFGDIEAKRVIKNNIKEMLTSGEYEINENTINTIIDFTNPDRVSSQQKFEILMYLYLGEQGPDGLDNMLKEWELLRPYKENGEEKVKVTKEAISTVYEAILFHTEDEIPCSIKKRKLDFNDKIEILAQTIFERYIGLGAIDLLLETSIDGVEGGTSGINKDGYVVKTASNLPYSYEAIWIFIHGLLVQLQCCTFGSQSELIRVCNNIYKYKAKASLSESSGKILGTMLDGSRILVARPPFADSYEFFLRKFDSAPSVAPQDLIRDENKAIPITTMKWVIKGEENIMITGGQGTGKTTFLKSVARFIHNSFSLRIQELASELNLRYTYWDRNISSFQETPSVSMQEGMNTQKKTDGMVNIVGEVADAMQAVFYVQSAMVASRQAIGTHHAQTAEDLVEALSNNLLEAKVYTNKKDAVRTCAEILNIDCHLVNVRGSRHIERITEIIPLRNQEYPSDSLDLDNGKEKMYADASEYFHRVTDPLQYYTMDIVRWEPKMDENGNVLKDESGHEIGWFKLVNMPTQRTIEKIEANLTVEEVKEFRYDLEMMKRLSMEDESEEVRKWTQTHSVA